MDYKQIRTILDLYFEGETTLEQEAELRAYFQQESVHPELVKFKPLFQFFHEEQLQQLDDSFDERLFKELETVEAKRFTLKRLSPYLSRVAAAVAIVFGLLWAYDQQVAPDQPKQQAIDWSKYEPETAEEAFSITSKALLQASSKLNGGAAQAVQEFTKIEEMGKFFK